MNLNITLRKIIKSKGKRAREERNREELQKQPENNEQNDIFSDYNRMELEISDKNKNWKKHKHVETKQHTTELPVGQ